MEPLRRRASQAPFGLPQSLPLVAVFTATFGVGLVFGFQPPLMAFILERGGTSSFAIGAVTSASAIAVIACGPVYPRLIDRLGLRSAIIVGTVAVVAIVFVMPILQGVAAWVALRFLTGCALGVSWIASEIWLNTVSTDQSRGTVMGIYATAFAAGVVAGPLLLEITGTAGWRPFHVGALCLAVTTLPLLFVSHPPTTDRDPHRRQEPLRMLRSAPVVMLAALIAGLVESVDVSLLPVFGLHRGLDERSSLLLVTVFLAGNVLLQLPIGSLADRLGRRVVLAACSIVSMIGPLLLPSVMSAPWMLWPLLFVWGGTMYGFYTQGIALLGESFTARELANANALFVMVYCAGGVVGPTLGGLAMDFWNPNGLVVFVSGAASLLAVGIIAEARR
ncbi:MAG: MFS transporter [Gammaproteobacteria bacterium]|nr:MAG: MFS transporter [Gammaproteobacteria bacterium]